MLAYHHNPGGITNQKIALLGLFQEAHRSGIKRINLPFIAEFNQVTFKRDVVPFEHIFALDPLINLGARFGLDVSTAPPVGEIGAWSLFHEAYDSLPIQRVEGQLTQTSLARSFFRSLVPQIRGTKLFAHLSEEVFQQLGVSTVVALRIEADWARHCAWNLSHTTPRSEQNLLSYQEVFEKLRNTDVEFGDRVYVVCDESALPVPKEVIRSDVLSRFGVNLFWKSDLLPTQQICGLSLIDSSLLDFELAVQAPLFVGITRSTFSCMVSFEKFARTAAPVSGHFIYNTADLNLRRRTDDGIFQDPALAIAADVLEARLSFHVAQLYFAVGDKRNALKCYALAESVADPDPEKQYVGLYRLAQLQAEFDFPHQKVVDTYLRAASILPERAEAWHGASKHCRIHRLFDQGYEAARRAIGLLLPSTGLFLEPWIYQYGSLDEFAVNASWTGRHWECADACLQLLGHSDLPDHMRPRILANARLAIDRLKPG